jgi:hypothetical protein
MVAGELVRFGWLVDHSGLVVADYSHTRPQGAEPPAEVSPAAE